MVEAAGKRGIKQLIIVFDDAPEENKETAEPQTCEGLLLKLLVPRWRIPLAVYCVIRHIRTAE